MCTFSLPASCGYAQAEQEAHSARSLSTLRVRALDVFSEWQAMYINYSGKLLKAQRDAVGEET